MKKSLIFALALMLVLAFASSAMAAQVIFFPNELSTKDATYDWTTGTYIYNFSTPTTHEQSAIQPYNYSKFTADGKSNYPYEIYLPNETNPAAYRIHTSYTKNTDACASCHATHTAVNGMLLQWYSAYETCMACHDGTVTTTYNVVTGEVGTAKSLAPGGMFGTGSEASLSSHLVTGAVEIAAAPGAGAVADTKGNWTPEFGCESCHTPHGAGGNARILAPDVNGAATALAKANGWGTVDTKTGLAPSGSVGITAIQVANTTGTELKNGIGAVIGAGKAVFTAAPAAYTAESAVYNVGAGYTFLKPSRESAFAIQVNGVNEPWTTASYGPTNWYIDNSTGVTKAIYLGDPAVVEGKTIKFFGIPTLKVTMDIDYYLSQTGSEAVTHVSGMNNFCGACHYDYNTASYEVYTMIKADGTVKNGLGGAYAYDTGAYSKAHRHSVGGTRSVNDTTKVLDYEWANGLADKTQAEANIGKTTQKKGTFTCLTCHVAHGTSYDYWDRLLVAGIPKVGPSGDAWTTGELVELAGSSALKRMPNMGTCETCHNKESGQDGYAANSSIGTPVTHIDADKGIDNGIFSQKTSQFVGMENSIGNCAKCHEAAVEEWIETQHNMFAPYDLTLVTGNYMKEFDGESGNVTAEQIALINEFYTLSEAYDPDGALGPVPAGVVAQIVYELPTMQSGLYNVAENQDLTAKDIFVVGQLPVGTRKGMEAIREYIVRLYNPTLSQYEYVVANKATWNEEEGTLEMESVVSGPEGVDNYTGSCFNCHALASAETSLDRVAGTPSNADKAGNRALLNGWYNFLYNGGDKPSKDFGISCEACHGAAKNHVLAPSALNIFNPANAPLKAQSQVCGRCHVSSGNKNGFTAVYQPWKLVSNEAITPGVVKDVYFDSTYQKYDAKTGTYGAINPNGINSADNKEYAYNTYAEQMDAYFSAAWESFAPGSNVLPAAVTNSNSGGEWTYRSKEGRAWFSGGHTQYTTFAVSKHFATDYAPNAAVVSCSNCHDSHGGDQGKYQLKAGPAAICATCHGSDIVPSKYMPIQSSNEVVMHDFGRLYNVETERPINTKYTSGFPRWE